MTCQCPQPGFCPILGREMPTRLHFLCQTREDYRRLFQQQAGLIGATDPNDDSICHPCQAGEAMRRVKPGR